jgi:hypothetical protein
MKRLALCVLVLAACSDDAPAIPDAPPDPCAPEMEVTGEYVDWDSTEAAFKGVMGAKFTLQSDATKTASTAPNGRFIMPCMAPQDGVIDVVPVAGSNYVPGLVIVDKAVIQTGAMLSYRSFTQTRGADFGFDAAKAGVFVNVEGTQRAVTVAGAGSPFAFDGSTWAAGNTGKNVYFPGVAPGITGMAMVSMSGTNVGTGNVEVAAGKITYVTLVAR